MDSGEPVIPRGHREDPWVPQNPLSSHIAQQGSRSEPQGNGDNFLSSCRQLVAMGLGGGRGVVGPALQKNDSFCISSLPWLGQQEQAPSHCTFRASCEHPKGSLKHRELK